LCCAQTEDGGDDVSEDTETETDEEDAANDDVPLMFGQFETSFV